MARHTQLAYAATMMALEDAGLDVNNLELPSPTPVIIGVSMNAMDVVERAFHVVQNVSPNRASPSTSSASIPQAPGKHYRRQARQPRKCRDGLFGLPLRPGCTRRRRGADPIRRSRIGHRRRDRCPDYTAVIASFIASGLSSRRNDEPEKASRPFDLSRDTGVISEGAGIMVLENLERAAGARRENLRRNR